MPKIHFNINLIKSDAPTFPKNWCPASKMMKGTHNIHNSKLIDVCQPLIYSYFKEMLEWIP